MTRKTMMVTAMMLLAVCLLAGGCSQAVDESKIDSWKDMLKIPTASDETDPSPNEGLTPVDENQIPGEQSVVKLYFSDSATQQLTVEERSIGKVEGIARQTMQELIKGPSRQDLQPIFPAGTTLLDINITPAGLCIIDLSEDAAEISSREQGELMVQAVANTLGQFPSVKEVDFLINGEAVEILGGLVDISEPVQADSHHL